MSDEEKIREISVDEAISCIADRAGTIWYFDPELRNWYTVSPSEGPATIKEELQRAEIVMVDKNPITKN